MSVLPTLSEKCCLTNSPGVWSKLWSISGNSSTIGRPVRRPWVQNLISRISVWEAVAYCLVAAATMLLLVLVDREKSGAYEEALDNYRSNAGLRSREAAAQLEGKFRQVYQGIRTLARLPGTRSIDRYARNFDENARSSAQEIYNNLAESVAISEVYIVPVDFDPDAIDPNTGKLQEPITTFDELIVGRTAIAGCLMPQSRTSIARSRSRKLKFMNTG